MIINAAVDRVELSRNGSQKVYIKGGIVDAADASVIYTEATALFVTKDVPAVVRTDEATTTKAKALYQALAEAEGTTKPASPPATSASPALH